jgi:hypothetical protein
MVSSSRYAYDRDPVQIAQPAVPAVVLQVPVLVRAEPIGRAESEQYFSSLLAEPIEEYNYKELKYDYYDVKAPPPPPPPTAAAAAAPPPPADRTTSMGAFSSEQYIFDCVISLELVLSARCCDIKAVDADCFLKMLLQIEEPLLCEHTHCLLPLLLECMALFPHKTSLQKHCLCLLHAIPKDDCQDCIRWVLAAMRNHASSVHVQWYACLLCESWMSTEVFDVFCAEGGVESVISAAKAFGGRSGNTRQTCRSIFWQLNEISKENKHVQASDHCQNDYDHGQHGHGHGHDGLYRSLVRFRLSKYNWEGTPTITVEV